MIRLHYSVLPERCRRHGLGMFINLVRKKIIKTNIRYTEEHEQVLES